MTGQKTGTAERFVDGVELCETWVRRLSELGEDVGTIQRLRQSLDRELAGIVVTASRLQHKARSKFGTPPTRSDGTVGVWWVTDKSLQQATPWQVAQHKSGWMKEREIADVCCGIGGDSIALARRGALTAIERDELTAAMARINLATAGVDRFVVECRDASEVTMPSGTQFHVDPDRREQDRRYSAPDHYSPSWNEVIEMVSDSSAIIKLAPRANLDSMPLPSCHHRCWISLQRTVREQSLLCGDLVANHRSQSPPRSAVAIAADGTARTFVPEIDSGSPDVATLPQSLLVDPDPAIRAAGLTESFARCYDLSLVGGPSGFLTANHLDQVAASAAEMAIVAPVLWSGPCDMKKIRKELRARNAKVTTAKVRGTDHDPAKILKPLKNTGEEPMTLWIGRGGDGVYAAISE